jgi:hypothetical protein
MSSLVPSPPANTPPVPRDNPSPPRLRTLSSPDHRPPLPNIKAGCCISPTPSPIGRCIVVAISSPWLSVDCCFYPRTRLMLPPMASSLILAAAVVFRRYRPMPLSSYDAPLSAVDTDRCRLRRAAVAFVVPDIACHRRTTLPSFSMLPSSKDAAVVVGHRRRTLLPYAVVSRRRRLLWSRMLVSAVA